MKKEEIKAELASQEYKEELNRTWIMQQDMLNCLMFCFFNAGRDRENAPRNFTLRMIEGMIQSVTSMRLLAKDGFMNICKRELRYLLELSIKSCFIVRSRANVDFESQIKAFEKLLNSSNINPINRIRFDYFSEKVDAEFKDDVKRNYGLLCKYVHSSAHQIEEYVSLLNQGRGIGYEGTDMLKELNGLIEVTFSYVIVHLLHSVPQWVGGDFMVEDNGDSINWYFNQSRYISLIDSTYDYKHERQRKLAELASLRKEREKF